MSNVATGVFIFCMALCVGAICDALKDIAKAIREVKKDARQDKNDTP